MRALVAEVGPEPAGPGLARPRREHGDRRVVGVENAAREGVPGQRVHQRAQQRRRLPDPVGERRALQFDAVAGVDSALAVERQVVGVLGHQHVGEQARRRPPALDGQGRRGRPGDPLASPAGPTGADVADDAEPAGHVVQHLGHVLAEAPQAPAAGGAGAGVGPVLDRLARQVVRQRAAERARPPPVPRAPVQAGRPRRKRARRSGRTACGGGARVGGAGARSARAGPRSRRAARARSRSAAASSGRDAGSRSTAAWSRAAPRRAE